MQFLRQSTAATRKIGPFVDSTDGVTPETGLTIAQADVRLSKNGGDFAQKNDSTGCTHDEDGWYGCPLDATDTGTLGSLVVAIAVSGALPVWHEFMVLPADVYDALVSGSDVLEVDVTQIGGDTQSATDLKDFADAGYDPATNKVEGVKTADALTANNDKTGYSLANAAITAAVIDTDAIDADALASDAVGEIADGVWDEQLTGATHNVPTSAGRRLRQIDTAPFFTTYYVNGTTGDDSNDGDAPDVPFATIGKALSSVSAGEHIVIAPGTYSESNLTLSTASVVVFCEPGVIIDSGGASACLTISASSCKISGAIFHPSSASVGLDVQAGADYVTVEGCCACQCSVGFDINGDATWLRNCRSIEHSTSGVDVASKYNRIDHCKAVGAGAAVRGFYLSGTGADLNQLLNCTSIGNTTAGFETVSGADQNTFAFCASGGSDGGKVDNGSNNAWSGYAVDPALTQDDILSDATPFDGANIDAAVSSRSSHSANDVRDAILSDSTPFDGANIDAAISSRSSHSANDVRDAILSDSTPFDGANIDAAISSRASKLYLDDLVVLGTITDLGYGGDSAWVETDLAQKADDYYNGCVLFVLTGSGAKQRTVVIDTAWTGTAMRLTVESLGQIAPNDTFALLPLYAHDDPDPSGYIDAAISTRSSHSAADVATAVWGAASRTLTGFGTLIADIWSYATRTLTSGGDATEAKQDTILSRLGAWAGSGDNNVLGGIKALASKAASAPTDIGGTFDPTADSLEAIRDRGDSAWVTGGAGSGSYTVTRTYKDGSGNAVSDLKVTCKNADESLVIATQTTDSSGNVTFNLDSGTYHLLTPSTVNYKASNTEITVSANSTGTITLTAQTIPSPSSPDKYVLYMNCADEQGDAVGAAAWSLKVLDVYPAALGADDLVVLTEENAFTSDASGQITFEVPKTVELITIEITRTMADGTSEVATYRVEIDGTKANASDQIDIADLL